MVLSDKVYKITSRILFVFVLGYLLLRIFNVETLHDEVATYIFYFYHGDFIGDSIQWDANNHLLNSFIGHLMYQFVGDNIPVLRLPNILAYVAFFFGTVQLTKNYHSNCLKILSLIALNSIPFIIEYFGNMRGYGLSLGFFIWALVYILKYCNSFSHKHLALTYLFLVLAVSANLTFVNSSLLVLGMAFIARLLQNGNRPIKTRFAELTIHGLFVFSLLPFIYFGLKLKEKGALYYGSLDGLWDVTGMTLSKYTLFISGSWLIPIYLIIFIGFLYHALKILRTQLKVNWSKSPFLIYSAIFFGNIVGILILALVLEVNYPEDRTAMYLILVFLLLIFEIFNHYKWGRKAQWVLLFFPLSFVTHLSLDTSVFSPDDRINDDYFATLKEQIKPNHSIMIYRILNWNWPYHESHFEQKSSVATFYDHETNLTDWVITKTTVPMHPNITKLYDTVAIHPASTYIAFKRKQPTLKTLINSFEAEPNSTDQEFNNLAEFEIPESIDNIQLTTRFHLSTDEIQNKLSLIVSVSDSSESETRYLYYDISTCYQGQLINDDLHHNFVIGDIEKKENKIKVYIWNRSNVKYTISSIQSELLELKTPENESR